VAHEVLHDAAALRLDVLLDGRADVPQAGAVLHLGDAELERGVVAVKPLRREAGQSECVLAELGALVRKMLEEESWTST
jgi:hypothetical protein